MATYFIPDLDADFAEWQAQFARAVAAHAGELGLGPASLAALAEGSAMWDADFRAHLKARDAAQAACTLKDETRASFTVTLQSVARQLQANPALSDELRLSLGLPAHKKRRRRVPQPTERPQLSVGLGQRFQHRVHITQVDTGRRARPADTVGCELWVAYSVTRLSAGGQEAPTIESDYRSLGLFTRTPALVEHVEAQVGQQAIYQARWVNRRGEPGPWSATVSATVTG